MATRQAAIRLSLRSGAFQSEMRRLTGQVATSGRKMGAALRAPLSAGLGAAKRSLAGFGDSLKSQIKTMGTLGGTIATGMLLKDALQLQGLYRNVAFDISKVHGEVVTWQDVQADVDKAVERTSQRASDLAKAYHTVFKATGDLEFSRNAMEAIGLAATASGKDISHFATAGQMMLRKFNIRAEEMPDAMAKMIEMTDSGAMSIEDLGGRFGMLAGEAKMAGMTGVDGMTELLGLFRLLDAEMGEKLTPALTMMFQMLKAGTSYAKEFKKAGVDIKPDMTFVDKFEKLLAGKGRIIAEEKFTGAARGAFDLLAKPFDEALKEAEEKGMKRTEAIEYALARFNESFDKASTATWDYSELQKRAAKRMEEDPTIKLREALNKLTAAFAQPKMIKSLTSLAEKLPALADKLAELIDWIAENPWKAAGVAVSMKAAGPAIGAAIGTAVTATIIPAVKTALGMGAAAGAAAPGAAAAAAPGAAAAAPGAAAGVAGAGALVTGAAVAAGTAVGGGIGFVGYKTMFEPAIKMRIKGLRALDEMLMIADETARAKEISPEALKGMIATLKAAQEEKAPTGFASYMAHAARFWGADIETAEKQHAKRLLALGEAESKLEAKLMNLERSLGAAVEGVYKFKEALPERGPTRGPPMTLADPKPGAYHIDG